MTIPKERTESLLQAGGFLIELARDKTLPLPVRQRAAAIARHFPTMEDLNHMAAPAGPLDLSPPISAPDPELDPANYGEFGPLRYSTRVAWPT